MPKNERTLNIKVPDKLYLALQKATEQKSISLAALVRMLNSDWVMAQSQDIKGVFTYPEALLAGYNEAERKEHLDVIAFGGYSYNKFGEALHDNDDCESDDCYYESLITPDELEEFIKKRTERRG